MYRVLVEKSKGKRPFGRRNDDIKADLQEVGGDMDWIEPAKDRDSWQTLVNAVMNLRIP
jgi:hypothetical protein